MNQKVRVILTGATGMVGEGVLHECLLRDEVESVLVINRKPCWVSHPRLKEIILDDFFDLSSIESQLKGYHACFFCSGISSVGKKEAEYFRITYELTINFAQTLSGINPEMTFCFISGAGTDSTEKGRMRWARVKGKTENDLMRLPFRAVYAFRPPFMLPTRGLKNALPYYRYVTWLYPLARLVFPGFFITLKELGQAMINGTISGSGKKVLEGKDIVELAKKPPQQSVVSGCE